MNNYVPHEALLFGRNDYAPSPARLKTVLFKNVSDAGTRRLLLLKGDADVAYDLGADQFDSLRNASGVRIEQADAPGSITSVSTPAAKTTRCWAIRRCGGRRAGWWIIKASPSSC